MADAAPTAVWSGGRSSIICAIRVRPLSDGEKRKREEEVVHVFEGTNMVVRDPGHTATNQMRQKRLRERKYAFDAAFAPGVGTEEVYRGTVRHLIDGVLSGYNGTVFAYGATGSGKTFTMLGTAHSPGVMVRTLADLYGRMEGRAASEGASFKVSLSYVEVYNENIRDLLVPAPPPGSGDEFLDLREDPVKGNCVAGVSEHDVRDSAAVMTLLSEGNRKRTQEPTAANRESSRSHAVLTITIAGRDAYGSKLRTGKLSLIDLAGSERAANTQNRGLRLLEGANINRSLLALGNCITSLANKGAFVPYRDSKLTRLLKDSLGGNARTVMISCVSPAAASFEETCNTLKYANRAKNIKTAPTPAVSEAVQAYQVTEYDTLITGLRYEVAQLKTKLAEASTLGQGGLSALGGVEEERRSPSDGPASARRGDGGTLSPTSTARRGSSMHHVSGAVASGPAIVSMAALASPALLRKTMARARQEGFTPSALSMAGVEGGGGVAGASPRGGFRADVVTGTDGGGVGMRVDATDMEGGRSDDLVIPEGYILVNAAEAAAAADKLSALREALLNNFQERMQVRRSLLELQAQNSENSAEVARHSAALVHVEQHLLVASAGAGGGAGEGGTPGGGGAHSPSSKRLAELRGQGGKLRKTVSELQDSIAHNAKMRADLVARLERAEAEAEGMRGEMDAACSTQDRRELLSLEYRVYLLELQKVELEQAGISQKSQQLARDNALRRARTSIKARDRVIRRLLGFVARGGLSSSGSGMFMQPGDRVTAVRRIAGKAQAAVDSVDGELWGTIGELLGGSGGGAGGANGGGSSKRLFPPPPPLHSSVAGGEGEGDDEDDNGENNGDDDISRENWAAFVDSDLGIADEEEAALLYGTVRGAGQDGGDPELLYAAPPLPSPALAGAAASAYVGFGGASPALHTASARARAGTAAMGGMSAFPLNAGSSGGGGGGGGSAGTAAVSSPSLPKRGGGAGLLGAFFGGGAQPASPSSSSSSPTKRTAGNLRAVAERAEGKEEADGPHGSSAPGVSTSVHSGSGLEVSDQAEAILVRMSSSPPAGSGGGAGKGGGTSVLSSGGGSYFSVGSAGAAAAAPGGRGAPTPTSSTAGVGDAAVVSPSKPSSWLEKAAHIMRRVGRKGAPAAASGEHPAPIAAVVVQAMAAGVVKQRERAEGKEEEGRGATHRTVHESKEVEAGENEGVGSSRGGWGGEGGKRPPPPLPSPTHAGLDETAPVVLIHGKPGPVVGSPGKQKGGDSPFASVVAGGGRDRLTSSPRPVPAGSEERGGGLRVSPVRTGLAAGGSSGASGRGDVPAPLLPVGGRRGGGVGGQPGPLPQPSSASVGAAEFLAAYGGGLALGAAPLAARGVEVAAPARASVGGGAGRVGPTKGRGGLGVAASRAPSSSSQDGASTSASALTGAFVSTTEIVAALTGGEGQPATSALSLSVQDRRGAVGGGRGSRPPSLGGHTGSAPPSRGRGDAGSDSLDDADAALFGSARAGMGGTGGAARAAPLPTQLPQRRAAAVGGRLAPLPPPSTGSGGGAASGLPRGGGARLARAGQAAVSSGAVGVREEGSRELRAVAGAGDGAGAGGGMHAAKAATNLSHAISVYGGGRL